MPNSEQRLFYVYQYVYPLIESNYFQKELVYATYMSRTKDKRNNGWRNYGNQVKLLE